MRPPQSRETATLTIRELRRSEARCPCNVSRSRPNKAVRRQHDGIQPRDPATSAAASRLTFCFRLLPKSLRTGNRNLSPSAAIIPRPSSAVRVVDKLMPLLTEPTEPPRHEMGFHATLRKPAT